MNNMLNTLCYACARFGRGCKGMAAGPWTGCAYRATPARSYIIRLDGHWYAVMMDESAHYVFGAGPDSSRFAEIESSRDAAIMATCSPLDTWRDAYAIANSTGRFIGELVPGC